MAARTTTRSVVFKNAFSLGDFRETIPPGTYEIETDEELLEGLSFEAYRRTLTVIRLPAKSGNPTFWRSLTIDPDDLEAALERDAALSPIASEQKADSKPSEARSKHSEAKTDGEAIDRADDEGMFLIP
jgi:hypothetical protein